MIIQEGRIGKSLTVVTIYRSTLCGRITGLLLLLVNNMTEPQHEMLVGDQKLVEAAIQSLAPIAAKLRNRQFQQVYHACEELALKVRISIERNTNVVSVSEAEYLLAEVQVGSSLDETGTQPAVGLAQGLYHGGKRPEVMPINPPGEAMLQEDESLSINNFAISDTALFSWT